MELPGDCAFSIPTCSRRCRRRSSLPARSLARLCSSWLSAICRSGTDDCSAIRFVPPERCLASFHACRSSRLRLINPVAKNAVCVRRCAKHNASRQIVLSVDFSACISCFNCMDVCPKASVAYRSSFRKETKSRSLRRAAAATSTSSIHSTRSERTNPGRRAFVKNSLGSFVGVAGVTAAADSLATKSVTKREPVTPPGSIGRDHFTSKCTACHLCISVCPTQVLAPSFLEYGIVGVFQPPHELRRELLQFRLHIVLRRVPDGGDSAR